MKRRYKEGVALAGLLGRGQEEDWQVRITLGQSGRPEALTLWIELDFQKLAQSGFFSFLLFAG